MARPLALAAAIAVSLLAVSGAGGAAPEQTPKRGGTLVMGTLREPPCLNAYFERCHQNFAALSLMLRPVLRGAFRVGPDLSWEPDLARANIVSTDPFTVVYRIRPEARWSDDTPITAQDFVFTQRVVRDHGGPDDPQRTEVRRIRPRGTKAVEVTFRARFSAWRSLFCLFCLRTRFEERTSPQSGTVGSTTRKRVRRSGAGPSSSTTGCEDGS